MWRILRSFNNDIGRLFISPSGIVLKKNCIWIFRKSVQFLLGKIFMTVKLTLGGVFMCNALECIRCEISRDLQSRLLFIYDVHEKQMCCVVWNVLDCCITRLKMKKQFFRVKQLADQTFSRLVNWLLYFWHLELFYIICFCWVSINICSYILFHNVSLNFYFDVNWYFILIDVCFNNWFSGIFTSLKYITKVLLI